MIRRFYALVDDVPVSGKIYGKIGGRPYEWIDGDRDADIWEEAPLPTNWWFRHLYRRRAEVVTHDAPDLEADDGTTPVGVIDQESNGEAKRPTSKSARRRANRRAAASKDLGAEDKKVVAGLVDEVESGMGQPEGDTKGNGPGPVADEVAAKQIKGLVSQAKQLNGDPEKAADTIAALDTAALGRAGRKGLGTGEHGGAAKVGGHVEPDTKSAGKDGTAPVFDVPADQRSKLSKEWNLPEDDPKFVFAMKSQENFDFINGLSTEQRAYLSRTKMGKRQTPSEADIASFKKNLEEVADKEAKRLQLEEDKRRADEAKAAAEAKRAAGDKKWAQSKDELRERIRARVEKELPDYEWGPAFDKIISATDERIGKNKDINVDRQIKITATQADADIDAEVKRREIAKAVQNYPRLEGVRTIANDVLADPSLPSTEFDKRAAEALRQQRNPDTATWAKMLGVHLYQPGKVIPFESLTPRLGYSVHYSIDLDGMTLPVPEVTDKTTPEELLDALFSKAVRYQRLHVTLETGFEREPDKLALPHRYWTRDGDGATYDLYVTGGRPRWTIPEHKEADITGALDHAYDEIRDRLIKRAKTLLDDDCRRRV